MQCTMDHIVLNIEDNDAMIAFYTGILMLEPERLDAFRAGTVPFPSVRLNSDTVIDLFPKRLWARQSDTQGTPNLNHLCIALPKLEWDALSERLKSGGVAIEDGPVPRWGAHGTGTSLYFRDPEGNLIEARYYTDNNAPKPCMLGS